MISVICTTFNQPDFLEYQYKLSKKFIEDKFEFFVYDNSTNSNLENQFKNICQYNNIRYFKVPSNGGGPSQRAGFSLNYALDHNYDHYGNNIVVLDSDLFPISKINFSKRLKNVGIYGRGQIRPLPSGTGSDYAIHKSLFDEVRKIYNGICVGINNSEYKHIYYFTNQYIILNMKKLKHFNNNNRFLPGNVNGITGDCGAYLHDYILQNNITHQSANIEYMPEIKENSNIYEYAKKELSILENGYSELIDESLLHFRSGSNWQGHTSQIQSERLKNLYSLLEEFLNESD